MAMKLRRVWQDVKRLPEHLDEINAKFEDYDKLQSDFNNLKLEHTEVVKELDGIKDVLPKLVETITKLESMLSYGNSVLTQSPFARTLGIIEENSFETVMSNSIGKEKLKISVSLLNNLKARRMATSSSTAVGSKELRAKNAAIEELDREIARIEEEIAALNANNSVKATVQSE